jgi:hypothetical protein
MARALLNVSATSGHRDDAQSDRSSANNNNITMNSSIIIPAY